MAEIKTGIFAKNVQKRLNRAQEKVLQKLGKADETKDEQFEQVVINFRRQESEGSRLQREMKAYMVAIKGMQQASINLTQSLHEVYEPDWHGKDDVLSIGKDCDALWEDFHNKLVDSTLLNLDAYLQNFPDLKGRVSKRSRKLIDYDSARHHVETLQMSGMKNDRKMMKAEDELKKAQQVFEELNCSLQNELPTLWDSRVDFYIGTFKSVTRLEARFHREISLVCRQLYEVMTQLAEQHSDKVFTIQGAPSDSGPLRLARTPSPPEDESPPDSPDTSSNHMLRPVSPGPPRPKSPTQGPPVPPPPKVTPTKEVAEEQIIDFFGGEFLPAPSPLQPNELPGQSLLDLDLDAFQPDESVSPIPQTAVPWDMWSANSQTAQPGADASFGADWSADFGSSSISGGAIPGIESSAAGVEGAQDAAQSGLHPEGDTTTGPPEGGATTAAEGEVSSWDSQTNYQLQPSGDEAEQGGPGGDPADHEARRKSTPGLVFTNEYGEQIEGSTEDKEGKCFRSPDGSGSEYETAEEWADGGQGGGWVSPDDERSCTNQVPLKVSDGWEAGHEAAEQELWKSDEEKCSADEELARNTGTQSVSRDQAGEQGTLTFTCEPQTGSVFNENPSDNKGGAFDSDPTTEAQGGGAFDSDPFAEAQGGGAFDSDPTTQAQGGGAFDLDPFAEGQGGGAFDSDPFAEGQGGGAFDSDPFAETQGGGAFDSDPFAETQGGGAFDSDPFAQTESGGAFDSDPFAQTESGGAFDSEPFAEGQGGGAFDSDPFAQTESGGAFESDQCVNSFPETCSGTEDGVWTSEPWRDSASVSAEGVKAVNRIHKEPENSDMSEDEAANRRLGKLYQELDTEKEEVTSAFNGLSQDAAPPSFFADFDKMVPEEPSSIQEAELDEIPGADQTCADEAAPLENMPIPSVIIEPASSNEGDDDRDGDIISPTAASDNDVTTVSQTMKHMSPSGGVSGLPDDFLYKVETMHDFEAANSDELELKRGDVVLVVPTESAEDQDAGWLTGIKESEWLARGASAQKGLFPENFTQRLE